MFLDKVVYVKYMVLYKELEVRMKLLSFYRMICGRLTMLSAFALKG